MDTPDGRAARGGGGTKHTNRRRGHKSIVRQGMRRGVS